MASCFLPSLLLFLAFLVSPSTAQQPRALVAPISKDPVTNQYVLRLHQRTPLVPLNLSLDLGGRHQWVECKDSAYVSSTYRPARCGTDLCKAAKSFACNDVCVVPPSPGCNNDSCIVVETENPFKPSLGIMGEVAQDVVTIASTDGSSSGKAVAVPGFSFNCAGTNDNILEGLAASAQGYAGFGLSAVSAPAQFAEAFGFPNKFAICLPSGKGSDGAVFFGDGPYRFLPSGTNAADGLFYTPLVENPVSITWFGEPSSEYYVGVTAIRVNNKRVTTFNATLLAIEGGFGGTKISTAAPYTVLENHIYRSVAKAFVKESKLKKALVPPVAPFGHCFDARKVASTRLGPAVPVIGLVLQSESAVWRITGANSMVAAKPGVVCLGFVDGGKNPRASIVIGGYQLENNLLQFDVANRRLGLSGSLLFRQTTCSNFNFNTVA